MAHTDATTATAPTAAAEELTRLGEAYFAAQHRYDPYNATLLGVAEFDGLSADPSREASAAAAGELTAIARQAAKLDPAALADAERVDRQVLIALAEGAGADAEHSLWAANASAQGYVSRQGLIFQAVPAMTIASPDGAARYLSRLSKIGATLDALGQRYLAEAADGRTPTAIGVDQSIRQLAGYLALPVEDDALLQPARQAADQAVREAAAAHLTDTIRPAMQRLSELLARDLAPLARPDDRVGIREIPGGEAGYLAAIARHTTTDLSPQEIHQIGLAELDELAGLWSSIGQQALGETDFATITARMRKDPALRFRTSAEIVAVVQDALDRAEAARDGYFEHYDIPGCVIEEVNPIDADSALAYYRPPAVDGSRPGAHCLLTTDPGDRFRYEYEALAFHESVPGHHLQLATAQTLDVPRYRRHLDVELCAFNEGWGLYAERLADEIGLYTSPISRLGMVSFAALRACRLVVDTGLHQFGWTRQQATDFMYEHTATTRENAINEIDRYIGWPGQALAYVTGKREIVRLRDQAQQTLGPRFDLRRFHHAVLGNGAIPLTLLDDEVAGWTAREQRA